MIPWDGVVGKVVGRRTHIEQHKGVDVCMIDALVVRFNCVDVQNAMRRKILRDEEEANRPARPYRQAQVQRQRRITTNR